MSLRLADLPLPRPLVRRGKAAPEFEVSPDDIFEAPRETDVLRLIAMLERFLG